MPVSALLIVIVLGMLIGSLSRLPKAFEPGLRLCQRPILRWAVAGLGLRLSLAKLVAIGGPALIVVLVSTLASLAFGWWLADRVGLPHKLGLLLGVGGAICGASAVVAADSVVQSEEGASAVSVGIITLLGTIGIVIYPLIGSALNMPAMLYGVWNGASLHEVAHVAAAGAAAGAQALEVSTVVKLARITLLAPVVFYLAWTMRRHHEKTGAAHVPLIPWFLVVFVLLAAANSTFEATGNSATVKPALDILLKIDLWLLAVGMAGVGLQTRFSQLKAAGVKPILVGAAQWVFLSAVAYGLAAAIVR